MALSFEAFKSKLAYGQLKNESLTDKSGEGLILPEYENQILELTNQGLIDMTTKKKLQEGIVALTFVADQNIYPLDTSETADYENLVKVLEIVTTDGRHHTPKTNSMITMVNKETLRFSDEFITFYGPAVDIHFQTHHKVITTTDEIDIPIHLYEALVLYVAGLYLSHMGGEEHKKKGDSYYGLYLQMLGVDEIENLSGTSEVNDRGFV